MIYSYKRIATAGSINSKNKNERGKEKALWQQKDQVKRTRVHQEMCRISE